jgi:hypothetical protein
MQALLLQLLIRIVRWLAGEAIRSGQEPPIMLAEFSLGGRTYQVWVDIRTRPPFSGPSS